MTRTTCDLCFRPAVTDHDWKTVPEGERPDLCWGEGANCEDRRDARIAELEAKCKALGAVMNSAAGEIVNGADRHKIANELLSPDAVRQWLKADDEECENADRLEASLAQANVARDDALRRNRENRARYRGMLHGREEARKQVRQLRDALEAVLRFPPGGVDDDEVPEMRAQGVEMWARARAVLDASREAA